VSLSAPSLEELAVEAARAWLVALLESRPLSAAARLPVSALAEEAPALCKAMLRALESDRDLDWLTGTPEGEGMAAASIRLAASDEPAATVEAVECLRRGILSALSRAPAGREPALLVTVGDRLAHVCARLASGAVAIAGDPAERGADDALADLPLAPGAEAGDWPSPAEGAQLHRIGPRRSAQPLWIAALERQLAEGGRSGRRFALLLVEVDGMDRLRLAAVSPRAEDVLAGVGRAIRERVRRADLLAHEDDGRIWLVAPEAGRGGATALAARLAGAVERAGRLRGAPLTVSVGVSIFPEDGRDAVALTEQAEEQMFAARAAGKAVLDGDSEEPASRGF
jgi:GGDEF domain-containing protein